MHFSIERYLVMKEQNNIESLIGKYFNHTIQEDERRELVSWIAQSKDNELIFNQIREILLVAQANDTNFRFDTEAAFERINDIIRLNARLPKSGNRKSSKRMTLSYRWVAAVAAALLMIYGGTIYHYQTSQSSERFAAYQEIIAPMGSRTQIVLPDGSKVNLNAGSTLRYGMNYGLANRDLWLDGEGFFDVSKSATPFIVHSGTVQIKALGTSFNVRAYSSDNVIETTLITGKVIVTQTDHSYEIAEGGITLTSHQKLILPDSHETANQIKAKTMDTENLLHDDIILKNIEDPLPEISWKENKWVIYRENLGDLAVKLQRRFDIEIEFEDEQLKLFRYNGSLPDISLEQVLKIISMVSPIDYSVNEKKVIISEKK